MKFCYLIITIFMSVSLCGYACEICGCSYGNFQIVLLPNFNKGFIGLRYGYSKFSSQVRDTPSEFSRDYYQTIELWSGYNFKRLQSIAFMPYIISTKKSDDGTTFSNGVGDLMLLVNYKVLTSSHLTKNERTTVRHELYLAV